MHLNIPQHTKKNIIKTVNLFANEGMELQDRIKNQNKNNPDYQFLFPNSKYYHYYLTHLAEAMRLNKSNKQIFDKKRNVKSSYQQDVKKQYYFQTKQILDQMPVGMMCQIVKQFVRRGLQPYTPLPQSETSKIYKIIEQPQIVKQKIPNFLKYINEEKQNERKQKQNINKKKDQSVNSVQEVKKQKKTILGNNILVQQMGIAHDGSMNDAYSTSKYQGLGKTQDMFSKFRKDKSQQYHSHAYCKICEMYGHQQKDCSKKYK